MSNFEYQNGQLMAEKCTLSSIAKTYSTPTFVYSKNAIEQAYMNYANALGEHSGMICYAVKANSNIAVLQVLAKCGAGFDIVSKGELQRVLKAGGDPTRIIFSGVGKTTAEMIFAIRAGIACFNVESHAEIARLAAAAATAGINAPVSLRVNPNVDAKTHPYISTGLKENKFGIDILRALEVYEYAKTFETLDIVGVDCHIGSQLTDTTPFIDALDKVLELVDTLAKNDIHLKHIDLGGGIGVTYKDEVPPSISDYLASIKAKIAGRNLSLILEPGRSIVANAGVLLTEVEYLKPTEHKDFAIVDAAMNDNIRPALYQAWQDILPVKQHTDNDAPKAKNWDIVGPVCETGDFLGKDRTLALQQGDILAMMSAGAYGFVMSSNYNSRTRAAEILIDKDKAYLVRKRETFDDLINGEQLLQHI